MVHPVLHPPLDLRVRSILKFYRKWFAPSPPIPPHCLSALPRGKWTVYKYKENDGAAYSVQSHQWYNDRVIFARVTLINRLMHSSLLSVQINVVLCRYVKRTANHSKTFILTPLDCHALSVSRPLGLSIHQVYFRQSVHSLNYNKEETE